MRAARLLDGLARGKAVLRGCIDLNAIARRHPVPCTGPENGQIADRFEPHFLRRAGSKDLPAIGTAPLPELAVPSFTRRHRNTAFSWFLFQAGVSASRTPGSVFS